MKKLILLWMFFLGLSNSVAQQCNIEITFTTVAGKWADQLSWNLLDNSGRYVLGGYFNDTQYASAISYVYNYVAKDPPYKLLIDNTKDNYSDNSVNYSVKVGGSVVATGTVVGTKKEIKTINLTLPATCACSTPVCEVCPNGEDFTFRTQADLTNFKNSFTNCRNIKLGNVTIGQSYDGFSNPGTTSTYVTDITDISALENVSETTGNLELMYNTKLANVMSLSKVKKIGGSLRIHKNILLENLNGLHNVESINGELSLRFNAKLKNLNALKATGLKTKLTLETNALLQYCNAPVVCNYLNTTGAYTISGNASNCISKANILNTCSTSGAVICPDGTVNILLTTQTTVDNFAATYVACSNITVNNLTIGNVDATLSDITSLVPLNSIIAVKGDLIIRNNPNLTSLEGLTKLKEAKSITIDNNSKLIHLDQLSNITTLNGGISISNNLILNNISGLSNIPTTSIQTTGLTIANNVALTLCNLPNFCQYLLGSGTRNITGNKANCISEAAVKQACYPIVPDANNILYVNTAVVGGDGSGNSWTNAIKELADVLKWANTNKANFTTTPLQIWVAKGTYKPMYRPDTFAGPNSTDRDNAFLLVENVKVYGGFAGTETTLAARDLSLTGNQSILSGDLNTVGSNTDNAYHILIASGAGSRELNGFTVQDANANGDNTAISVNSSNFYRLEGAGFYNRGATLSINYCNFKNNNSSSIGGAIINAGGGTMTIRNSLFYSNTAASNGSVIYNTATLSLVNSTLANNTSNSTGGVIYGINATSSSKVYNSIVYGNNSSIVLSNGATLDQQYALVQGQTVTSNGNIIGSTDPLFVNSAAGDFSLLNNSPVINKGDNALYTSASGNLSTDKDLAGNQRLFGTNIDMGAYEYAVVTVPAPTALAVQIYTGDGTIADLTATGSDLKWYAELTGGTALATTTALTDNTRYYVSQTVSSVESTRTEVLAKRISDDTQTFCGAATVGDLVTTPLPGNSVSWYSASSGGTALASNAPLATGDYYVEMQSTALPIQIASGLSNPCGVAVANDGKIWVANFGSGNNTIQQLDANGNLLATKSGFNQPIGINIQKDGRLLVGDWGSSRILRTDANGNNPVAIGTGFNHAFRAVEQANGKLLVADTWNNSIKRMNTDGTNITVLGSGFGKTDSVAEDRDANIWVADWGNNAIKKMNSDGSGISSIGTGISQPFDLKIDQLGRIIFTQVDGKLRRMNPDGSNLETLYTFASGSNNLEIEPNGSILVTEASTGKLYRLSPAYTTNRVKVQVRINSLGGIAYVDQNVSGGTEDGSSWANAIPQLADAMKCARQQNNFTSANPLKILVSKGTYKPMYNAADGQFTTSGNRDNAFVMVNNVQLYGGFDPANGIDDLTDARIFGNNGSILSGDIGTEGVDTDNAYHVVVSAGAVGEARLDGFYITRGYASGSGFMSVNSLDVDRLSGGGIYNQYSRPILMNLTVANNTASSYGGGIYNYASNPVLTNVTITNNTVSSSYPFSSLGGGIYNAGSSPILTNVMITNNTASGIGAGGGMYNHYSNSVLTNVTIANNTASSYYSSYGGGIYNIGSNPTLTNVTIANNRANGSSLASSYGGGIGNYDSAPKIYNSIIYGNTQYDTTTILNIKNLGTSTVTLKNSLVQDYTLTAGDNNLDTDPLFTNATTGDYSLQSTSAAIDAGSTSLYTSNGGTLQDKDLAGNARVSECTIDMGAYEYQSSETYASWDGTSWDNTTGPTQTLGACINNNYNLTNSFTTKNLKIINGSLNIKPNETVTVYGNISQVSDNSIVLENDANLIQINDNAINDTKKITVKRNTHMRKMDYTYWGTPVSNQKLLNDTSINDGFSVGTPNNRIYNYNEPDDYFVTATDQNFVPGKGYAIRGKDGFDANSLTAANYQFVGGINNGIYTTTVQKSKNKMVNSLEYEHGYNLIGNPYPSNIDFDKFFNLNTNSSKIFGKVWFWTNVAPRLNQSGSGYNGNNYAALTLTGGSPPTTTQPNSGLTPTQFIKVGQGFIVQVRNPSTLTSPLVTHQLDFNNSIRTDEAGVFYNAKNSSSGKDRFWLQLVSPQQFTNTILVGYVNGATNQYDGDYDADVMSLGDDSVYTLLGSQKLQIEGRQYPLIAEDVVPLGVKYAETGIYQILLSTKEGIFNNNQTIYIKDKLLNKTVNISEEAYSFQAIKGTDENRFEIVYKTQDVLDISSSIKNNLIVYKDEKEFIVKSNELMNKVQLFDMSGRLINEISKPSNEIRISHQNLVNGTYVLKIYRKDEVVTKKVIK